MIFGRKSLVGWWPTVLDQSCLLNINESQVDIIVAGWWLSHRTENYERNLAFNLGSGILVGWNKQENVHVCFDRFSKSYISPWGTQISLYANRCQLHIHVFVDCLRAPPTHKMILRMVRVNQKNRGPPGANRSFDWSNPTHPTYDWDSTSHTWDGPPSIFKQFSLCEFPISYGRSSVDRGFSHLNMSRGIR